MKTFDRWASIGAHCLTKFQINRYIAKNFFDFERRNTLGSHHFLLRTDKDSIRNINGGSCLFDWTVIRDYRKITKHIGENFSDCKFEEADFAECKDGSGNVFTIACSTLGVEMPHLFAEKNHYENWRAEVDTLRPKIEHTVNEFLNLREHSTLYFVTYNSQVLDASIVNGLVDAICKSRGEQAPDFHLLVAVPGSTGESLPAATERLSYRPINLSVLDHPDMPWLGSAETWDRIFDGFGLNGKGQQM